MERLLLEYLPIVLFIGIAGAIAVAFTVIPLLIAPTKPDAEKVSAYECGFDAFSDSRMKFDVRFYLVSLLFLIFDLEVAFLFPWAITLSHLSAPVAIFSFWSMMAFLAVLTVGYSDGFGLDVAPRPAGWTDLLKVLAKTAGAFFGLARGSNRVTFDTRTAPVLGRIGMELTCVDVGKLPEVRPGARVRLPGRRTAIKSSVSRVYISQVAGARSQDKEPLADS